MRIAKSTKFSSQTRTKGLSAKWCLIFTCLILFGCFNLIQAQSSSDLAGYLDKFTKDPSLKGAQIGVCIRDMKDGKILAGHNENLILTPASIHKLVVTAAATDMLGTSFRFKTELMIDGRIIGDTLKGNLIIKGTGDPTLCSSAFSEGPSINQWLKQIQDVVAKQGIRVIDGHVIADGSINQVYPEQGTWQWIDLGNYYASGSWGINIADNLYTVTFRQQSRIGDTPVIVKVEPEIPGLILYNELTTAAKGSGDNAYIFGAPLQEDRIIRGTIPAGTGLFTIKGSMPNPEKFASFTVYKHLISANVVITGNHYSHRDTLLVLNTPNVLKTWESPKLDRIIAHANAESNNLICEALLQQIGIKRKSGKFKYDGAVALTEWLDDLGIKDSLFFVEDGSGLSLKNGYSPSNFSSFLYLYKNKKHFKEWQSGLPIAGRDGTVRNFMQLKNSASVVSVKSGSLSRVRCYAGYMTTASGRELNFVVMVNQFVCSSREVRQKIESLLIGLTGI